MTFSISFIVYAISRDFIWHGWFNYTLLGREQALWGNSERWKQAATMLFLTLVLAVLIEELRFESVICWAMHWPGNLHRKRLAGCGNGPAYCPHLLHHWHSAAAVQYCWTSCINGCLFSEQARGCLSQWPRRVLFISLLLIVAGRRTLSVIGIYCLISALVWYQDCFLLIICCVLCLLMCY